MPVLRSLTLLPLATLSVIAYNARGQAATSYMRIPITGDTATVTMGGSTIPSTTIPISQRTKDLALM